MRAVAHSPGPPASVGRSGESHDHLPRSQTETRRALGQTELHAIPQHTAGRPPKFGTCARTMCAENSNISRHLAEFRMIESEIAFADVSDNAPGRSRQWTSSPRAIGEISTRNVHSENYSAPWVFVV